MDNGFKMSSGVQQWRDGNLITVTFCVTQDCNLACSYCYMVGKNNKHVMDYNMAKKIVDFVLADEELQKTPAIAWDFIGGEPLLEMELIDKISDYIVVKMHAINHVWKNQYRFTFSSNGILYHKELVRKYIKKHDGHISFGLSIDGTKEKHDSARKKKDGTGSYDEVVKNVPLWLNDFPGASTKATFARDDLKHIKDSVIHLWNLGIKDVMANIVYEDVWQDGDEIVYEQQLMALADYIVENNLWNEYTVAFFGDQIGLPLNEYDLKKNRCGAGHKSLAFDNEGNIYPCIRFLEMCSSTEKNLIVGHVDTGINRDYLRALACTTWRTVSPQMCNECEVGGNCGWCIANNLEDTKSNSIFNRTTYLCKMHKANVKANQYLWMRYTQVTGKTAPYTVSRASKTGNDSLRYLYFVTSDQIKPHCGYQTASKHGEIMSNAVIRKGLQFCLENHMLPIFLGRCEHGLSRSDNVYHEFIDYKILDSEESIPIYYGNDFTVTGSNNNMATYLCTKNSLPHLAHYLISLFKQYIRINMFIQDFDDWNDSDLNEYEKQLSIITCYIIDNYTENKRLQLNVLNDLIHLNQPRDCGAGRSSISMAPNGDFYICPAFYFSNKQNKIGNVDKGFAIEKKSLMKRSSSEPCFDCDVLHCNRCLFSNYSKTNEINIPSDKQCKINYINGRLSNKLRDSLNEQNKLKDVIINKKNIGNYIDYLDLPDTDR